MDGQPQYWAFLSYSHQDRRWATWLHQALEAYRVPSRLVGRPTATGPPAPRRFRPIFCDREELPVSADLAGRILAALDASAFLIVLCSPAATRSPWVDKEIAYFAAAHGPERIFTVIVDGDPFAACEDAECLPRALRASEPLAADLRPEGDGPRLAVLKLIAGMLGVGLDELIHRDAHRRHRQMMAVTAASVAVAAVMSGLAIAAVNERNEARAQHAQAEGLVEFMLSDLRDTLEPAGRLDALDAVGNRALAYYASQRARHDAGALGRRARVLHLLGSIREQRGDLDGAQKIFEEAAASTGELLARNPGDGQRIFDHAQSVYWVGYVAWRRGLLDNARRRFLEYQRLADQLIALQPANAAWRAEVGYANSNLGTVLLAQGRADEAAQAFERVLAINRQLAAQAPGDRIHNLDLAQSYAWLADAELARSQLDAAARDRQAERRIYEALIAAKPSDSDTHQALAVNRGAVGRILLARGEEAAAETELARASGELDKLIAAEPENVTHQEKAVSILLTRTQARIALRRPDAAAFADRTLRAAEALAAKDPSVSSWQSTVLGSARLLRVRALAQDAASAADRRQALAPAAAEAARLGPFLARSPQDLNLARVVAEARLLAGDYDYLSGDPRGARRAWQGAEGALRPDGETTGDDRTEVILANARARMHRAPTLAELGVVNPLLAPRRAVLAANQTPQETQ
jgi:tetratricopeptide (TPR) repeat protein